MLLCRRRLFGGVLALGLTLATGLALFTGGCASERIDDRSVPISEASDVSKAIARQARAALLVDARPDADFAAGHLPGAVNIRLEHLQDARFVDRLRSAPAIIVYGQNPGSAGAMALAKRLIGLHMRDVRYFPGGFDAWTRAGGRIER